MTNKFVSMKQSPTLWR